MSLSQLSPSLWETVKCDFKSLFPEDVFQMWFEPVVCLEATADSMTLGVPNDFAAIWIHDNYLDLISQRLRLTSGRMVHVSLRKTDAAGAAPAPAARPEAAPRARANAKARPIRYDERLAVAGALLVLFGLPMFFAWRSLSMASSSDGS